MRVRLSKDEQKIVEAIHFHGGHVYLAGGAVRDHLWGMRSPNDLDFEVYGLEAEELIYALEGHGSVNPVGKAFGVLKLYRGARGAGLDFALPRRESKEGRGHKGFMVEADPTMTTEEACRRRDFTINSMLIDMKTGELVDHWGGRWDVENAILRATSEAYMEDPLRVLRGFQLIKRYDLTPTTQTIGMSRDMLEEVDTLSVERIWGEWYKWASMGYAVRKSLEFLRNTGWMVTLYPDLYALWNTEQDPEWHPEGPVMEHTIRMLEALNTLDGLLSWNMDKRMRMTFAALLHDIGKGVSSEISPRSGRLIHPDHEEIGASLAVDFLHSIGVPAGMTADILPLIREHMFHRGRKDDDVPSERSIRRLAKRLEPANIRDLAILMQLDRYREDNPWGIANSSDPFVSSVRRVAFDIEAIDNAVPPILKGKHLIEAGLSPGPVFGVILKEAYQHQMDGLFVSEEGAVVWLREYLDREEDK